MDYKEIYQQIINDEAILFLGAGFSMENICENGNYKSGKELANYLCDKSNVDVTDYLNIACSKYIQTFPTKDEGVIHLINELKQEFKTKSISDAHEWILKLPWKRIYTTNYDDVAEYASHKLNIKRESFNILSTAEPKEVMSSIIHINGYIDDILDTSTYDEFENKFKITHESYFKDEFLNSDWKSLFIDDLYEVKRVIFLGYSLDYDFSLQSLIAQDARDKCIFVDYAADDKINADKKFRFESLGECTFEGVRSFSNNLKKYEGIVNKIENSKYKSFSKITPECYPHSGKGEVTQNEVFSFFVMGHFEQKFINSDDRVIIDRKEEILKVQNELDNKVFLIHSKFGNGKSIFKHILMSKLCYKFNVFELNRSSNIYDEVQMIEKETEDKYFIVIDDFGEYMNRIGTICNLMSDNGRLILFVRTPIKDNLCYQLYKKNILKPEDIEEIDLNFLNNNQLNEIYNTFNTYGYWGKLSKTDKHSHIDYYKKKCKNEFSNILYFVMDSDNIKDRISKIMLNINNQKMIQEYMIADAIMSILGIKIRSLEILEILDIDIKLFYRVIKGPTFIEIIKVDQYQNIRLLSPIFADYILKHTEKKKILAIASIIYNNSNKVISKDLKYSIRKNMISRSNISLIINCKGDELDRFAIGFFDSLRESPISKTNPFYWLQYAISMLNVGDLIKSNLYFENAFKTSEEFFKDPDLSHINTHYSRYLFEKILKDDALNFDFNKLIEIHRRLFVDNNNGGSNLKYCLRQILYYRTVFEKFISSSGNITWFKEYNDMLHYIVKVSIDYFDNSKIQKYEIDAQVKENIRNMSSHFNEHVNKSLCDELFNKFRCL